MIDVATLKKLPESTVVTFHSQDDYQDLLFCRKGGYWWLVGNDNALHYKSKELFDKAVSSNTQLHVASFPLAIKQLG